MNRSLEASSLPKSDSTFFIYGPPGSGKTTLGRRLAENLHLPFYDLDDLIVNQAGMSIPEIFGQFGEADFRQRERAVLEQVLADKPGVIALGGGALLDEVNRATVEEHGRILCLQADFETLVRRAQAVADERPLIRGDLIERFQKLMETRCEHYDSFPVKLRTDSYSLDETITQAQIQLGAFHITGMGDGYDVRVTNHGIDSIGNAIISRHLQGPIVLVSDANVAMLYSQRVMAILQEANYDIQSIVLPAGEDYKTIQSVINLWTGFLESNIERRSTILALGGGVVSDLAGFAAATYLRGLRWVVIPTSLLNMIDASLGGKTGADLPQGKNLIGAFHSPALVLTDPFALNTLPIEEIRNGMAEVVKHAIIADPTLFELCKKDLALIAADWDDIVRRAMAVKIRFITEDPYEKGARASLNLGHTLGHAIELTSQFQLKHGEAVAIGTVAAARLSEKIGLAQAGLVDEIKLVLDGLGLPTEIPDHLNRKTILEVMKRDKKVSAGKIKFVLPVQIGEVQWGLELEDPMMIFP
jgi:shikimate kinase / 3-dehydroquinate synthase